MEERETGTLKGNGKGNDGRKSEGKTWAGAGCSRL
jgi:hypothetical protein